MAAPIEDYAIIGDTETVALVSRAGSIDWFCAPRFDSPACLAGLLGGDEHGAWSLAPVDPDVSVARTYRGDTLVLETVFTTATGSVAVIDFMPIRGMVMPEITDDGSARTRRGDAPQRRQQYPSIVRVVEGISGSVRMRTKQTARFDYGGIVPWVRHHDGGFLAIAGADGLVAYSDVALEGQHLQHVGEFTVAAGERRRFSVSYFPSHLRAPERFDIDISLAVTQKWWERWAERCTYDGPWREAMMRSLLTLKALTYAPTGGIVAAATTSLPEWIGSVRNWDYRYCWLRDATFTLQALLEAGYDDEAAAWSDWLRRSVAGDPDKMQIMYGVGGERRLMEYEVEWLPGYESSAPVRVGNAASGQFQLDVYGEVMDMFLTAEKEQLVHQTGHGDEVQGLPDDAIDLARFLVDHVATVWHEADDGIWEVRGPRRHFVHSKVMAWVAVNRWLQLLDTLDLTDDPGPWRDLADEIHADVCARGFNPELNSFTQYYGSTNLDASLLIIGIEGFLPPEDPRLIGTIEAVERTLLKDGFVLRYETDVKAEGAGEGESASAVPEGERYDTVDGLPPGEGAFLLTTFWLLDALALIGRVDDAAAIFERLVALRNDVGLLAEEYDPVARRFLGNFPQAFSHVGLLSSGFNLHRLGVTEASPPPPDGAASTAGP